MNKNSQKRIASNNKWTNAHYERINIAVPLGSKERIKKAADTMGETVSAFIKQAIAERLKAMDSGGKVGAAEGGERLQGYMSDAVSRRMQQEQDGQDIPSSLLSKLTTWLEEHRHSKEETLDCISFICEER